MSLKIFITGVSGFVGGTAAKALSPRHEVLAMARSEDAARKAESLGARPVACDLLAVNPGHLQGIDVVVHCAAYVKEWGTWEDFHRNNVLGTQALLNAAKAAGVSRFIHISTEAVLFRGQDMLGIDESYAYPSRTPYFYARSKAAAERAVLSADSPGFLTLALRPRLIWGPGDQSVLPVVVDLIRRGRFVWIGNGAYQTSTTHVDNLVQAIELALIRGVGGNAYFIADGPVRKMKSFLTGYVSTQGITPPERNVPRFVARWAAHALEIAWRILRIRKQPPLTRLAVDLMSAHCTLRIDKAKRDLGYQPEDRPISARASTTRT